MSKMGSFSDYLNSVSEDSPSLEVAAAEELGPTDLIIYTRDELLSYQNSPLSQILPRFDIEVDVMIWKREAVEEDMKRRRDPRERTRRENDGIILSPQRGANFKLGCSMATAAVPTAAAPQPSQQRRIGSGRLLTREWEPPEENFHRQPGAKNDWTRDRKKFNSFEEGRTRQGKQQNGSPRGEGEANRSEPKNQRQGKNANGNFPNRRQNDDKRNNRNNGHNPYPEAPEWFTEGPTSRHDRIDLHGFEEFYGQDEEREKSPEIEPAAKSGLPDIVQDTSTKAKRDNVAEKASNEDFNFDEFMKIDVLKLSDIEQEQKDGNSKKPQSRFSQFFNANDGAEDGAYGPDVGAAFISAWCKDQPQGPKIQEMENVKMPSVNELEAHVLASARPLSVDEDLPAEFIPRAFRCLQNNNESMAQFNVNPRGMHHDAAMMAPHPEDEPQMMHHGGFMRPPPGMPIQMLNPHQMEQEHFPHRQMMHPGDLNISEEEHAARLAGMMHPQGMQHVNMAAGMDDDIQAKISKMANAMKSMAHQNEDIGLGIMNHGQSPTMMDDEHMAAKFAERRHFSAHAPTQPMLPPKHLNPPQANPLRPSMLFSPQFVEGMSTLPPDLRFIIAQAYPSAEMLARPEFAGLVGGVQHGSICPSHLINIFVKTHNVMPPRQRETLAAALHYIWAVHRGASPMNTVPNRGHLVAHTANIMQNALIKKKLEEQAENFKKRQDGELAFTPTAVLRKMTNVGPYGQEMSQHSPTNDSSPQQVSGCSTPDSTSGKMMMPQYPPPGHLSPSKIQFNPAMHIPPNYRHYPPQAYGGQFVPPRLTGADTQWWNQEGMGRVIRHAMPPGLPPPRAPIGRHNIGNDAMSMMTVEELERNQQYLNDEDDIRGGLDQ